jgi:surface antigen
MSHPRHHSRIHAGLLALLSSLALAACQDISALHVPPIPQAGQFLDQPPPPVTVVRDGPAGELINGPAPLYVPDAEIDAAIAADLRPWLTAVEKRQLAEASQRAAIVYTLEPVVWQAVDPSGARTAAGEVVAVGNVYRAVRGALCRDARQIVVKDGKTHQDQVTLCRRHLDGELAVWIVGQSDQ